MNTINRTCIWLGLAVGGLMLISGCAAKESAEIGSSTEIAQVSGERNVVTAIEVGDEESFSNVKITTKAAPNYNVFRLTEPNRLIIDVIEAVPEKSFGVIEVNNGAITTISLEKLEDSVSTLTRITVGLTKAADYKAEVADNVVIIRVLKGDLSPEEMASQESNAEANAFGPEAESAVPVPAVPAPEGSLEEMAPFSGSESPAKTLTAVEIKPAAGGQEVLLSADGKVENYTEMVLTKPLRLVIDLFDVKNSVKTNTIKGDGELVKEIRIAKHDGKTRVVIEPVGTTVPAYSMSASKGSLVVSLSKAEIRKPEELAQAPEVPEPPVIESPSSEAPATSSPAAPEIPSVSENEISIDGQTKAEEPPVTPEATPDVVENPVPDITEPAPAKIAKNQVKAVEFYNLPDKSRVSVLTKGSPVYEEVAAGPDKVIVDIKNTTVAKAWQRPLDTSEFKSYISLIKVTPNAKNKKDARLEIRLKQNATYNLVSDEGGLHLDFERPPDTVASSKSLPSKKPEGGSPEEIPGIENSGELAPPSSEPPVVNAPEKLKRVKGGNLEQQGMLEITAEASTGTSSVYSSIFGDKVYSGQRISLEFQKADLHHVLRLIAEVSKFNVVISDDVKGTVDVKLVDVPWDQALDIILQNHGLDKVQYGNIIRIAPADQLKKEREVALANEKAAKQLEPLKMKLFNINYAEVSEISSRIKNLISERGMVDTDTRTNTVIVRDIQENLSRVENLIKALDTQTPQVRIESRIVQASDSASRSFGIQWGPTLKLNGDTGHEFDATFPRSFEWNTDTGLFPGPAAASAAPQFTVDVPGGSGGMMGFRIGTAGTGANQTFALDLRLRYMEIENKGRVISRPSVTVLDNKTARIIQGKKIPYLTSSSSGSNVVFVDAGVSIDVTPHVASDGSIVMAVSAKSNEPTEGTVADNPILSINEANTELLVKTGTTAVLGGVYKTSDSKNNSMIPLLGRIPILGWLFKSQDTALSRAELLIFMTPTILATAAEPNAAKIE